MIYIYLTSIPVIVGGLALFFKLRNPWLRLIGMGLVIIGLFVLLILPFSMRLPQ